LNLLTCQPPWPQLIDFSTLADAMSFSAGSVLPLEAGSGSGVPG
jgi:hypothetical protein